VMPLCWVISPKTVLPVMSLAARFWARVLKS